MANTYELIASQTVTTSATDITFSSIASTYTDIELHSSVRDGSGDPVDSYYMFFNGNTIGGTTLYSDRYLRADNSNPKVVSSGAASNNSYIISNCNGNGATASSFSSHNLYISSYASNLYKSMSLRDVAENNSGTNSWEAIRAGLYSSSSAISSIRLWCPNGFLTGSSFYLYGIKKN